MIYIHIFKPKFFQNYLKVIIYLNINSIIYFEINSPLKYQRKCFKINSLLSIYKLYNPSSLLKNQMKYFQLNHLLNDFKKSEIYTLIRFKIFSNQFVPKISRNYLKIFLWVTAYMDFKKLFH